MVAASVVGRLIGAVTPRVVNDEALMANARRKGSMPRPQNTAENDATMSSAHTAGSRISPNGAYIAMTRSRAS